MTAPLAEPPARDKDPVKKEPVEESGSEAALFSYMSGEPDERARPAERPGSRRGKVVLVSTLAVACVVLAAVPRTRQSLRMFYRNAVHAGGNWLNPPPAPLPQAVVQHDSFGQEGDEYKLPTAGNIPDATTDASQIRVLPVVDPTAKTEKSPEANGPAQATTGDSNAGDHNQTDQNQTGQNQTGQGQSGQAPVGKDQIKDSSATSVGVVPGSTAVVSPGPAAAAAASTTECSGSPNCRAAATPSHIDGAERCSAASSGEHGHSVKPEVADGFHYSGRQREQAGRGSDVID
jgi:hypothetical protein